MQRPDGFEPYLSPGRFVDSDHPAIVDFARKAAGGAHGDKGRAVRLFYAVRDEILYDPYVALGRPENYMASTALRMGRGWCVSKAALLAACARLQGIPARCGYADVVNHLSSPKLRKIMGTDVFAWHSFAELYLGGRWVKATPAFNRGLCEKLGLHPLEFDGDSDSLFHEFDRRGNRHMEYIRERGAFADVPFEEIVRTIRESYPSAAGNALLGIRGDFQQEAG